MSSSKSKSSSKSNRNNGSWSITNGVATWSTGTTLANSSYKLTVPGDAALFSVATPASRTKEFSVSSRIDQLVEGSAYSTFTGSATAEDELKIQDAGGTITDDLFTNFSSVEELELDGALGYTATLGTEAQEAGIRDVEAGDGNDSIDASAMTGRIEIEGERGDDTLIGGQGNDKLEGGKGADQIDLSAGGADKVEIDSCLDGSGLGVTGSSFSGYDAITGFTSADDRIEIDYWFKAVEFVTESAGFDFTNVDAVVATMNAAVSADPYSAGNTVIFTIDDGLNAAVYSATIIDADRLTSGIQAAVANPYMLTTVDSPLVSGDII